MYDFDLIVLGGGAAGEKGAAQAAYFGKKVALVERQKVLGGAMVNTGTLPSKTLRESALYLSGYRQRGLHGADVAPSKRATVDDFLFRLKEVVAAERSRMQRNLAKHGISVVHGSARFVDPHTVDVDGQRLTAAHFLIATGSSPHRPSHFPFDHQYVYDSDEIVAVHTIPERMVVVGGGVIGCEYACLFAALGVHVTVVEARPTPLGFLDGEVVGWLTDRMRKLGVEFRMPAEVERCDVAERSVQLTLKDGAALTADIVLVCAGRQANTDQLNLGAAGLTAGKRGQLDVDGSFRTAVPHISAAGDVLGFPALASTSMEQARVAAVHLFDLKYKTKVAPLFPYGIYTIPEVSMVGETEDGLQKKGVPYVAGVADFAENARGLIIGETGKLKLLFRRDDMTLVGAHCLGEGATELIHIALTAMTVGAKADLFIELCFNYPTLSEAYKYATYDALGKRSRA